MKHAKPMVIFCLVLFGSGCVHAQAHSNSMSQPPASICGHWIVKKAIPVAVAPNPNYLGLRAEYLRGMMHFGNIVKINKPLYKVERLSQDKFFSEFHNYPFELGINGNSVVVIDVLNGEGNEVVNPGTLLVVRGKNHILTLWNGVYYLLSREALSCGSY